MCFVVGELQCSCVDVHGECVLLLVNCNVVATEHGRYGLSCIQKL